MSVEQKIWSFFKDKGLNDMGIAGLMGNYRDESGFKSNNLQNSYQKKLGHTDESYTEAVDNNTYHNFINDSAGYGLAQWTFWSRKQGLYEYAKSVGKSIGDLYMQLEFTYKELSEGYKSVLNVLKNATSVLEASNAVLLNYERPADQSEAVQARRAGYGQEYYDMFADYKEMEQTKEEVKEKPKLRFNIHAGHNPSGQVASGSVGYLNESDENRAVCLRVVDKLRALGHEVHNCTCDDGTSQKDVLQKIVANCLENEVDFDVSIHFNAIKHEEVSDGKTKGTEVWIYPNSEAEPLAKAVCDSIAELGFTNRGVKMSDKLYVLKNTKAPALLIECCFVDDVDDVLLYNVEKMANAIVKGLTGSAVADVPTVSEYGELYYVVVGAYRSKENAEKFAKHLAENGYVMNDEGNLIRGVITSISKGKL